MTTELDGRPLDDLDDFRDYRRAGGRQRRNALIERHQGLAYHLAGRYQDNGIERDDLRQVAVLGLVKAVERFDPERGVAFAAFAKPFILGELRHHFRDLGWELHVPRPLKDRSQQVRAAVSALRAAGHEEPTAGDVAAETGLTVDEVLEALDVARSTRTRRFEAEATATGQADHLHPRTEDEGYPMVENRVVLEELLSELDERDQRIVTARFFEELSQQAIAEELGISQVHVSRLLTRILARLQERVQPSDDDG